MVILYFVDFGVVIFVDFGVVYLVDFGADAGFSMTNLGNLDRIRHAQGFPNSSRKMTG